MRSKLGVSGWRYLGTALALVLGVSIHTGLPAFAQGKRPAKEAPQSMGVPFVSTAFPEDVQSDKIEGPLRLHLTKPVRLAGGDSKEELRDKLAALLAAPMAEKGLLLMTPKEVEAAKKSKGGKLSSLYMASDQELIFRHRDQAALKELVGKLTFIGSRDTGKLSGVIDAIWVSILPSNVRFGGGSAMFQPQVLVRGMWHGVTKATFNTGVMEADTYNSEGLAKEVIEVLATSSRTAGRSSEGALSHPDSAEGIPSQGVTTSAATSPRAKVALELERLGFMVSTEGKALGDDWARISASKGHGGKLPEKFLHNEGLDGSWQRMIRDLFTGVADQIRNGSDSAKAVMPLDRLAEMLNRSIQVYRLAAPAGPWPSGMNPSAAYDASQTILRHKIPMARKLDEACTLVKTMRD